MGAVFYVLWSIVHFQAAAGVFAAANRLHFGPVQRRVHQDALFLLACAIAVLVIAAVLTWRNSRLCYC